MAPPTPPTSSLPSSESKMSGRSLLRRLRTKTSLLSLRPPRRHIADFHIQLDDAHRVYSPNDLATGHVCITVERALPITHLTVSLVGYIDLFASAREPGVRKRNNAENDGARGASAVTLCRDEHVLCGQGRLEPGVYKFGFELEFCKLPGIGGGGLPTSLDFGRGSISYSIVSTLTRPVSVNPTTSCTTPISLMETIDISKYPPPKPRNIRLDPVLRNSSRKTAPRPGTPSTTHSTNSPADSTYNLTESLHSHNDQRTPITATVELLTPAALRGENLALKISIQHTKHIKSLNGIILTFMRQTRIDPAGDTDDVSFDKLKGAPISTTFRKDLAQAIYPLIIDPTTLTSTVRANLRVPEDVFPTITNVPGGAVEFKYWVEVVLDLGGKLRGKLDGRNDLFIGTLPGSAITVGGGGKMGMGSISVEGGVMIETERVRRREKSVVSCRFEVVVGTTDSVGRKGRLAKAIASGRLSEIQERRPSTSTTSQVVSPPSPQPPPPPIHQEAPEYDMSWQPPPIKEKEQLRLAEQLLMPSAPGPSFSLAPSSPGASSSGAGPSSPGPSFAPSAPILEDVEENNRDEDEGGSDDKTERERRRLFGGESLPPGLETSESSAGAASAPLLMEDVDMERLPEYRR